VTEEAFAVWKQQKMYHAKGELGACAQDPDSKTAEQYSARNRFVKELTALGVTFDHYGRCKYGTEADAAQLPPPHQEGTHYHGIDAQRRKVLLIFV